MPALNVKRGDDAADVAAASSSVAKGEQLTATNLRQRHNVSKGTTVTATANTSTIIVSRLDITANNNTDKAISKQHSMQRQLHVQSQEEQERKQVMSKAFSNLIKHYLQGLLVLCIVGIALLCIFAPTVLAKWTRASNTWLQSNILNPTLPPPVRLLITIYPMHISVRRDLPGFFQAYAIATPHNIFARRAVQHAASLRLAISNQNGQNIYRQKMALVPWDVQDFTVQLPTIASMDRFCGSGHGQAFYGLSSSSINATTQQLDTFDQTDENEKRQDLMIWCLLASGHHDGYVKFQVQDIEASLSRGISGIAISTTRTRGRHVMDSKNNDEDNNDNEDDHDSNNHAIDSSSILFLPQHDSYKLSLGHPLGPSTLVPRKTLAWIVGHVHLPLHSYRRGLEQFLYQVISDEISLDADQQQAAARTNSSSDSSHNANQTPPPPPKWLLWTAACTDTERLSFQLQYRLMATNCITTTTTSNMTSSSNNSTATAHNSSSNDCCSFYDPALPPLILRRVDDD